MQFLTPQSILWSKRCFPKNFVRACSRNSSLEPPWRIMFFGSDSFAVKSLQCLCSKYRSGTYIKDLQVTTTSAVDWRDKHNPVYEFAQTENLNLNMWPITQTSISRKFDLGIVVSFGYLIPSKIIDEFPLGIMNVHGSLLPRWRGAAPIIRAIMNGDTETGVTIMKINPDRFDTGDIIRQYGITISPNETSEVLTDRLATIGANLLMECVRDLPKCLDNSIPQPNNGISYAKKVTESTAKVLWTKNSAEEIYNQFRALKHIFPLSTNWHDISIKLLDIKVDTIVHFNHENTKAKELHEEKIFPGLVEYSKRRSILRIQCMDGRWVCVNELLVSGKKKMSALQFNNGFLSKIKNSLDRRFRTIV